jgi:thymidylate kinase
MDGARIKLKRLKALPALSQTRRDALLARELERLTRIQQAYLFSGDRAVVVFEGMDAAGKGGTIRQIAWAMDPRSLKVWPIGAPNEIEKRQHYLQRFWTRLPERSQIALFDRSWYGRVLVERVEGLASAAEWRRAYREINEFERQIVDAGIRLAKVFLHVSKDEQLRRFEERMRNPETLEALLRRFPQSRQVGRACARGRGHVRANIDPPGALGRHSSRRQADRSHSGAQGDRGPPRAGVDLARPAFDEKLLRMARRAIGYENGATKRRKR